MIKIFDQPALLEKTAKQNFSIPEFIMMENAAVGLRDLILKLSAENKFEKPKVLIFCGKGNNGADGYALARLLQDKAFVLLLALENPTSDEAKIQTEMCRALGIPVQSVVSESDLENLNFCPDFIVDCLYGTGFKGELKPEITKIIQKFNKLPSIKIACDIPSGLFFKSDYTVTMGELKTALFSDKAKEVCGKIIKVNLGISDSKFESGIKEAAWLIQKEDVNLPLRTSPSAHKGTYGHTTVFAGEKAGAGIIAATAALNFGSGLTTLVKTPQSNLEQFKISPQLMLSNSIPEKTKAVVFGPGLNPSSEEEISLLENWISSVKAPAVVLDAGILVSSKICCLLEKLNHIDEAKIVITPHLSELSRLLQKIIEKNPGINLQQEEISVSTLSNSSETKIKIGKILNELYPKTTVVMKSANTFIASENEIFVCADGVQSLAKGGSGDVLAGMIGALLSQNYSAKEAAITGVEFHALAAAKFGSQAYDLTPEKLIQQLS